MKFGIFYELQLPRPWLPGSEQTLYQNALSQVELADGLGYDYAWQVEHHFLEEYSHSPQPEVFLAAASQRTKNIRLGHGIIQLTTNHPARVAERVAALDLVSNGRVEFGMGEGASITELGPFDRTMDEKRAVWEDGVRCVLPMFKDGGWEYRGPYFEFPLRNVLPKPVQKPHPPLLIGGGGRRMLSLAAREADIVSVNPLTTANGQLDFTSLTEAYADQRLAWIKAAAGQRFDALEINILVTGIGIGRDRRAIIQKQASKWGLTLDEATLDVWLTSPHMLFGTESEIVEILQMRRERFGISYITIFGEEHLEAFAPIVARLAGT